MGKKSQPSQPDYKMNLNDMRSHPFVISRYSEAMNIPVGTIREIPEEMVLKYAGAPAILISIEFKGGTLNLTNWDLNLKFNGIEYLSTSDLISVPEERIERDLKIQDATIELTGTNTLIRDLVLNGQLSMARITFSVAFVQNSVDVVGSFSTWRGIYNCSEFNIDYKSGKMSLRIKAINSLAALDRIPGDRHAPSIQKMRYPNDRGLDYVNRISTEEWRVN